MFSRFFCIAWFWLDDCCCNIISAVGWGLTLVVIWLDFCCFIAWLSLIDGLWLICYGSGEDRTLRWLDLILVDICDFCVFVWLLCGCILAVLLLEWSCLYGAMRLCGRNVVLTWIWLCLIFAILLLGWYGIVVFFLIFACLSVLVWRVVLSIAENRDNETIRFYPKLKPSSNRWAGGMGLIRSLACFLDSAALLLS